VFGKRLKKLREEKKLTQEQLGKLVNLSQQTIGHYEVNRAKPDLETMRRFAEIFNVSTDYLLGRTDNRNERTPSPSIDDELNQIMRDLGPDVTLQFYDLKGMSQEEKEQLKIFLQGLKARRKEKK
jgi:transcriptional regulator with XRE-family HTH domain